MALCQGHWNELAELCKKCIHLRVLSPDVDPNKNYYSCGKYLLKDGTGGCPRYIPNEDK